jgi:hypothetical protein
VTHLDTRTPASVSFTVTPSPILGFTAIALDATTGNKAEAWGATEIDARQRAEYLVQLREAA